MAKLEGKIALVTSPLREFGRGNVRPTRHNHGLRALVTGRTKGIGKAVA
jgi:hypothetical protein